MGLLACGRQFGFRLSHFQSLRSLRRRTGAATTVAGTSRLSFPASAGVGRSGGRLECKARRLTSRLRSDVQDFPQDSCALRGLEQGVGEVGVVDDATSLHTLLDMALF